MSNTKPLTYEDYLAHYGVPGMKWGVRKSQSTSSTPKRSLASKLTRSGTKSEDAKSARSTKKQVRKQGADSLSTKELNALSNRKQALDKVQAQTRSNTRKPRSSEDAKVSRSFDDRAKTKGAKNLSNSELKALVERLELEQRYEKIKTDKPSAKVQAGRFVRDQVVNAVADVATDYLKDWLRSQASSTYSSYRENQRSRRTDQNRSIGQGQRAIGR